MRILNSLVLTVALVLSASAQETKELKIATASELSGAIEKLAAAFEKQTGIHVVASLGSSPDLFVQLKSGAPFDVFLSADKVFPAQLEEAGLAEPGTFELYGRGVVVLWWRNHGPVGPFPQDFKVLTGSLDALKSAAVHKIAVVNAENGPYAGLRFRSCRPMVFMSRLNPSCCLAKTTLKQLSLFGLAAPKLPLYLGI